VLERDDGERGREDGINLLAFIAIACRFPDHRGRTSRAAWNSSMLQDQLESKVRWQRSRSSPCPSSP
jgi:hypothetical protein